MSFTESQVEQCNSQFLKSEIKILNSQKKTNNQNDQIIYQDIAEIINKAEYPTLLSKILIQFNETVTKQDIEEIFYKYQKQFNNMQNIMQKDEINLFVEKCFTQQMRKELFNLLQQKDTNLCNQSAIPNEAVVYIWSISKKILNLISNEIIKNAFKQIVNFHH